MVDKRLEGKRYIALVRCSTKGQADTSIDDQIRLTERFATDNGMVKVDEVRLEGVSGSVAANMDAVVAGLIKRKTERNDFEVILVQDASRFTRAGAKHSASLQYDLERAGVEVIGALNYTLKCDFSEVRDALESTVARQQAKSIAAATARGSQSALEDGRMAHSPGAPYGLDRLYLNAAGQPIHIIRNLVDGTQQKLDPTTGAVMDVYERNQPTGQSRHYRKQKSEHVTLIPGAQPHVAVVHRIYRRALLDGWGIWRIASELNGMRIPSPGGRDWTLASVRTILNNPVYTGRGVANRLTLALFYRRNTDMPEEVGTVLRTADGQPLQNVRPAEDWFIVNYPALTEYLPEDVRSLAIAHHAAILDGKSEGQRRRSPDKHVNSEFLLKHILKCKEGLAMTGRRQGRKNGHRYYAVSRAYSAPRDGTHLRTLVPADPIEKIVLLQIRSLLMSMPSLRDEYIQATKLLLAQHAGDEADRAKLEAEVKLVDRRIGMALEQLDDGNEDAIRAKLAELRGQRRALVERLSSMAEPVRHSDHEIEIMVEAMLLCYSEQGEMLGRLPAAHLRELLAVFVESLTVDLQTMEFQCVLRVPAWGKTPLAAGDAAPPMGLGSSTAYKFIAEAHPPAAAVRYFRFWLIRRAA